MIEGDLARRLALTSWILLLAGPLFAQEVDPAPTAQRVIEEIIVTSRRREENLQLIPASVAAFTAEDRSPVECRTRGRRHWRACFHDWPEVPPLGA